MVALHPTEAEDTEGWGGWRSKKKHKADHGHKKGHVAIQGHSPTGISRPCTEVLRTRTYSSAASTLRGGPRGQARARARAPREGRAPRYQ